MEHLIALGHRRIALAISDLVQDSDHQDRLEAYEAALEDHNIDLDRRLYFHVPPGRPDGSQVVRKMMSMAEPPTAIFFTDPIVAMGALNESHKLGVSIPGDISILGFDDTDIRNQVFPQMTAICQDARRLGYESFLGLSKIVTTEPCEKRPCREAFSTWLEINDTTGKPSGDPLRILPDGTRVRVQE